MKRTQNMVFNVAGVAGILTTGVASMTIWLLLAQPLSVATAVNTGNLPALVRALASAVGQALEAILVAELVDNDSWELLIQMTRAAGRDSLAEAFLVAKAEEDVHLGALRDWLSAHGGLIMHGADVERSRRHLH